MNYAIYRNLTGHLKVQELELVPLTKFVYKFKHQITEDYFIESIHIHGLKTCIKRIVNESNVQSISNAFQFSVINGDFNFQDLQIDRNHFYNACTNLIFHIRKGNSQETNFLFESMQLLKNIISPPLVPFLTLGNNQSFSLSNKLPRIEFRLSENPLLLDAYLYVNNKITAAYSQNIEIGTFFIYGVKIKLNPISPTYPFLVGSNVMGLVIYPSLGIIDNGKYSNQVDIIRVTERKFLIDTSEISI